MNYDAMTDRELDVLVAEKVMGWMCDGRNTALWMVEPGFARSKVDWRPASKIADAFSVVEAMRERGRWFEIETEPQGWHVVIGVEPGCTGEEAEDESLPRAICIAALRALECK